MLLWTLLPIYHMVLFAISPRDKATSGRLWPEDPTLDNFRIVFQQKHYLPRPFLDADGQLAAHRAVATGVLTLAIATAAAFAISRLQGAKAAARS